MRVFYRRHMLSAFLTPNHSKHPSLAGGISRYQWDKQIKQQVHNFMSCTKEIVHEKFWDTKGVIWVCKSKMDKQHNGQKKTQKNKRTNNDLQTATHKTEDRAQIWLASLLSGLSSYQQLCILRKIKIDLTKILKQCRNQVPTKFWASRHFFPLF